MTTTTKILLGIVGAAAAGVAIGMLFAPAKGSETRENIRNKANEWADNLGDMWNNGKEQFENARKKAQKVQTEM